MCVRINNFDKSSLTPFAMLEAAGRVLHTVYRSWRLQPSIDLTLDWDGPLIHTVRVGEPPLARAVRWVVRSARHRGLTLVSSRLEVRFPATAASGTPGWTAWTEVAPLERFVALPWVIRARDEGDVSITTTSLATRLAGAAFPSDIAELRLLALDDRRTPRRSPPLLLARVDLMPT